MVDRPLVGARGETEHHAISLGKVSISIARGSTATYQKHLGSSLCSRADLRSNALCGWPLSRCFGFLFVCFFSSVLRTQTRSTLLKRCWPLKEAFSVFFIADMRWSTRWKEEEAVNQAVWSVEVKRGEAYLSCTAMNIFWWWVRDEMKPSSTMNLFITRRKKSINQSEMKLPLLSLILCVALKCWACVYVVLFLVSLLPRNTRLIW